MTNGKPKMILPRSATAREKTFLPTLSRVTILDLSPPAAPQAVVILLRLAAVRIHHPYPLPSNRHCTETQSL